MRISYTNLGINAGGPALCLVDVVDLHLHESYSSDHNSREEESLLSGSRASNALRSGFPRSPSPEVRVTSSEEGNWTQLVLEPARPVCDSDANPLVNWPFQFSTRMESTYPYTAYYVIHDAGLHLVRLPWLQHVAHWCHKLSEDPIISTSTPMSDDSSFVGIVKEWQSSVRHLICAKLPVVSDHADDGATLTDGQFRVCGLMEFPQDLITLPDKTHRHKSPGSNPHRIDETDSTIHAPKSEFKLHLQRMLKSDGSGLPVITGLSTQNNLTQIQLVQFFLKATELLRSGPLDRLTRARTFVEQYTNRLADHLSLQYQEAIKLAETKRVLQENAERMTKKHACLLERQQQIDKRLSGLTCRIAGKVCLLPGHTQSVLVGKRSRDPHTPISRFDNDYEYRFATTTRYMPNPIR
ncbi:unnamed protein product [Echinostoma caproni]|uniref:VPS37 C-terminal domain-containing protein n=1 Tax=Echinostoma caproni TaxID=27848 RepID=A0A183B8Q3_9TREM|nr:unnamed protein product [Echinostoma caproni]